MKTVKSLKASPVITRPAETRSTQKTQGPKLLCCERCKRRVTLNDCFPSSIVIHNRNITLEPLLCVTCIEKLVLFLDGEKSFQ